MRAKAAAPAHRAPLPPPPRTQRGEGPEEDPPQQPFLLRPPFGLKNTKMEQNQTYENLQAIKSVVPPLEVWHLHLETEAPPLPSLMRHIDQY